MDPVDRAIHARWRLRLGIAVAVMAMGAVVSTGIAVAYGESPVVPALLWCGTACVVIARRAVPHGIGQEERPAMGRSALWVVLGVLLYVVVPVVLGNL